MSNFNYDSYCGLYCGACSIMMAYKTGVKDPFASYWTDDAIRNFHQQVYGKALDENEPIEIKCYGCKTDVLYVNCRPCKIRNCAIDRKMEHCIDCGDYPCKFFEEVFMNEEAQKQVPHLKTAGKNLTVIRNVGTKQWLEEQARIWRCPECQTESSWYTTNCTKCGKDLSETKDFDNVLRSLFNNDSL